MACSNTIRAPAIALNSPAINPNSLFYKAFFHAVLIRIDLKPTYGFAELFPLQSTQRIRCVGNGRPMIPPHTSDGLLPPGIHSATWNEFIQVCGQNAHRHQLLGQLRVLLLHLRAAGCKAVYIDGSFVTSKQIPSDYDACWDTQGVTPNILDPVLLNFNDGRKAMKAKYGGDIFPAHFVEGQSGEPFMQFFQKDKSTGAPKGIIAIDLRTVQ